MLVGIYDISSANGWRLGHIEAYEKILDHNRIPTMYMSADNPDFWNQVKDLSLFIMRFHQVSSQMQVATDILPVVQNTLGIKCYPNVNMVWHFDDKVKQYHMMKVLGYPITDSWIFYDKETALDWADNADYPVVFKLKGGAGSKNVLLVENRKQAQKLVRRMFGKGILPEKMPSSNSLRIKHFNLKRELHHMAGNFYRSLKNLDPNPYWFIHKNYVLFQKFLPNNDCDTRITVIGNRAFAYRRMVRKKDFRASGSGILDYNMSEIDLRTVKIAFDISKKLGYTSMAYDFIVNESGDPEFCELSYGYVSYLVRDCPGYWDSDLNWHEGHYWPEYLHLIDALDIPDLKCPDLEYSRPR